MSKSDDNTNELESYGVWVKNSTGSNDNTETPADTSDELNLDDVNLDLPDFDDSDFSDMFKDEPQSSDAGALDDFGSEDDTTLSTDELANITDGFEVEQVEAPADSEDLDLGNFEMPESTEAEASEEVSFDIEENEASDEVETEEVSFDEDAPAETTEESSESEEVSFGEDEEISLDDFMDGGFSDESVASGNNGYEAGSEPVSASSETEELSLDDFMDGESFDSAPESPKESDIIEDEAPLDMDITFDDSADTVKTEDNVSLDISDDDDLDYDTEESEEVETEEVSMDDFGSSFTAEESPAPRTSSDENISTEDIDLSDFGIDADAEETPIVQDVEEAKNKEKVVDYDLTVGDENTASAPVVNEIKSEVEDIEEAETVTEKPAENSTVVDNSLLQQIVSELSSLKDEMNMLKSNLNDIKSHENTAAVAAGAGAGAALAAGAAIAMTNDDIDPEKASEDQGGFFSGDDEDETIALSFDELDNIMNTAEFSDTVEADNSQDAEETKADTDAAPENTEEPVVDDTISEEPVIEETSVDIDDSVNIDDLSNTEESNIEQSDSEKVEIEEITDETDNTIIEESVISTEVEDRDDTESVDSEIENAISNETDTSLDDITFDEEQTESFDFSDEKLEEPKIDEFIPDGNDELYENEELPDEISIPKGDDLLVESTSTDFMDSVKETNDDDQAASEFISTETDEEEALDLPSELPDNIADLSDNGEASETIEEDVIVDDDIPTVDKVLGDEEAGEPAEEEIVTEEEAVIEDTAAEEEVTIEEPVIEETAEDTV